MKKILLCTLFTAVFASCNDGSENNAEPDTSNSDSSLYMTDGTVNADTIDKRTDARVDKVADSTR